MMDSFFSAAVLFSRSSAASYISIWTEDKEDLSHTVKCVIPFK